MQCDEIAGGQQLVKRDEITRARTEKEKIEAMHQLLWQRPAETSEVRQAEKFLALQSATKTSLTPLEKYAQVLLLSNELMFVD